ncbi:hypothetical protein [Nonomuraea sp. NPDC049141]|uniref:hypothetical protein n=1 Tax=unclassified Nonomuraea TaxID=2593643 RepID=UPI0033D35063
MITAVAWMTTRSVVAIADGAVNDVGEAAGWAIFHVTTAVELGVGVVSGPCRSISNL